jgi:hypothetical protein
VGSGCACADTLQTTRQGLGVPDGSYSRAVDTGGCGHRLGIMFGTAYSAAGAWPPGRGWVYLLAPTAELWTQVVAGEVQAALSCTE